MKPEIKKLLILNLPYLLFVWLFDKVGAAVRLSPGADASAKLLHLGDGFTAAFSSIAPSFHPADLALGIAGAVIVRLIIYVKGKNAKKYRKGMEYGSARWGNAEDIKPYTDPVFENNIPLTRWHYWYGGFPKEDVINFVQLSDGNAEAVIKNATWFDIDDIKLADK